MKQAAYLLLLFLLPYTPAIAQGTIDKLLLEEAKTAYANGNHALCLERLEELNKRGNKGLVLLHLKIMAISKLDAGIISYAQAVQIKSDVNYYLNNYENSDFEKEYKDVYEVSKSLSGNKYNEGLICHRTGKQYYDAQSYAPALTWLLRAYEFGYRNDSQMQYDIAYMYDKGMGTSQNYEQALYWYQVAANNGSANAMNNLGVMYSNGKGVADDHRTALVWFKNAATKGNKTAMFNAGLLYYNGLGTTQDYDEASKWFSKAADNGHVDAMYKLGLMYVYGQGVKQDNGEAKSWFNKAGANGHTNARMWGEAELKPVKVGSKWGFQFKNGTMAIEAVYEQIWTAYFENENNPMWGTKFQGWCMPVKKNGKWGLIDRSGKAITPFKYDYAGFYSREWVEVEINGKKGLVWYSGKEVLEPVYEDITIKTGKKELHVKKGGKWGLMSLEGKVVIGIKYDRELTDYGKGHYQVSLDGKYGVIDSLGRELIAIKYEYIGSKQDDGNFIMVGNNNRYGILHLSGKEITPLIYSNHNTELGEGYFKMKQGDKWGFVDINGNTAVDFKYEGLESFSSGLAAAKSKGKWGYIDKRGNWVIKPKYSYAGQFKGNKAYVSQGKTNFYIDKAGKKIK